MAKKAIPPAEPAEKEGTESAKKKKVSWQEYFDRATLRRMKDRAAAAHEAEAYAHVPGVGLPISSVKVYETLSITDLSPVPPDPKAALNPPDLLSDEPGSKEWEANNAQLEKTLLVPQYQEIVPKKLRDEFAKELVHYRKFMGVIGGDFGAWFEKDFNGAVPPTDPSYVKWAYVTRTGLLARINKQDPATLDAVDTAILKAVTKVEYALKDYASIRRTPANITILRRVIMRLLPTGGRFVGPLDLLRPGTIMSPSVVPKPPGPAVGVLIRHEQAWRMKGLTIGKLLHSLCLAPGEVTQIATVDWERGSKSGSTEDIGEMEDAARTADRERSSHEVTKAVANETQTGTSDTTSGSEQRSMGAGGALLGIGGSGSDAKNSANARSVNYSMGTRDVSADSNSSIHELTSQHASNARSRRATLVQEVSVNESERFETRVVANYNHMHALNMLYYEVLQVYELSTRSVHAERCIFLPMNVIGFTIDTVRTHATPLIQAAIDAGQPILAKAIHHLTVDSARSAADLKRLSDRLAAAAKVTVDLKATLKTLEIARDAEVANIGAIEHQWSQAKSYGTLVNDQRKAGEEAFRKECSLLQDEYRAHYDTLDRERRNLSSNVVKELVLHGAIEKIRREEERLTREHEAKMTGLQETHAKLDAALITAAGKYASDENNSERGLDKARTSFAQHVAAIKAMEQRIQEAAAAEHDATLLLNDATLGQAMAESDMLAALNEKPLYFNQALWMRMSPATVEAILNRRTFLGTNLLETVDPHPIAVEGEYVAFRWGFPADQAKAAQEFQDKYVGKVEEITATHVLPTGGVFAESVLGRSNAAEKLDLTRFWKWDKDTIPILPSAINKLRHTQHDTRGEAIPGQLGASAAQLGQMPEAPPTPGRDLMGVIGASMFRDMSGSEVIKGLLGDTQKLSSDADAAAQARAHENISAYLDQVENMLPQIMKAMQQGGSDPTTKGAMKNSFKEAGEAEGEAGAEGAAEGEAGSSAVAGLEGLAEELGPEALLLL